MWTGFVRLGTAKNKASLPTALDAFQFEHVSCMIVLIVGHRSPPLQPYGWRRDDRMATPC